MQGPARKSGFTLLELLIAISIFALLSLMAYSGLSSAVLQRKAGEEESQALKALQTAFLILERDLQQAVDRPIQSGLDIEAAFEYSDLSGQRLSLTRTGWSNPLGQPRGALQRVSYTLDDKVLYRQSWFHLDRVAEDPPQQVALFEEVEKWEIRFMDKDGKWVPNWPQRNASGQVNEPLPLAVEFTLVKPGWGRLHRLIRLAAS
ncbi:MAG: type II secretion system minor pseudopilin GspJ [Gammaproteobacteria bacterium]|nr:type II secretion system minor pseudopilin GspJ [Gammaproteobacteria bacterium]